MKYCCCLCDAVDGAIKEGRIQEGERVPLCARHRADLRWKRREQRPAALLAPYVQAGARAALVGARA
jgi:hypothetical protein